MFTKIKRIFLNFLFFAGIMSMLIAQRNIHSFSTQDYHVYLPNIMTPPCVSYDASMWIEAPDQVYAGELFTTTIFLQNDGCSTLGMPIYGIQTVPDISPPPHQNLVAIEPNQIDVYNIMLTAPITAPLTLEVSAGASFEVNYPPPGGFGNGNAGSPTIIISVEE
jgi:hypothetical protein